MGCINMLLRFERGEEKEADFIIVYKSLFWFSRRDTRKAEHHHNIHHNF
jgi:hypothetical protein